MRIYKKMRKTVDGITTKIKPSKNDSKLKISDLDEDSEVLSLNGIGITNIGTGVVILKTNDGKEFPISSFSAETAKLISEFKENKGNEVCSIYNMIEQICDESGMQLVKIRIYSNGNSLRSNLYFTGKKDIVLRNFRSSDAIALAVLYKIPILIRKDLLEENTKIESK